MQLSDQPGRHAGPPVADGPWPAWLAYLAAAVVGLAMLGWLVGIPQLASFVPDETPLPITSAYALLFAAMLLRGLNPARRQAWIRIGGGLLVLFGVFTLAESRISLAVDPHVSIALPFLGLLPDLSAHPTPHAALGLVFIGLALALSTVSAKRALLAAQASACLALLWGIAILTGYLHGKPEIYAATTGFGASVPATLAMLLLALGILAHHARHGVIALFRSPQLGGRMLRRLLPLAVLLPILVTWLSHAGVEWGWYSWELEGAILSILGTVLVLAVVLIMAIMLNRESEALHRANERLEKIFSSAPVLTAHLDREFNFIKVNAAYAAADGRRPEDLVGRNHFALYPSADNEAIFRRVIETGQPYSAYARPFEFPDRPERGVTYWDWNLYPVFDSTGQVEGLVLGVTEVTERQRAEQERLAAEAKFRELFNALSDAVFIHAPDGPFIEVNQSACQRLGYSREELLHMGPRDIDSAGQLPRIAQRLQQLQAEREIVFESEHVAKDGQVIPVEINARLVELGGVPYCLSVARDISARKAFEHALRESHETTQALINATTESALLIDVDGTVRTINQVGAQRFQQAPGEMLGQNIFAFMRPEVTATRRKMLDRVIETCQPYQAEDKREGRYFEHNLYPVLNAAGQVTRVAIYAQDVTEKRQAQILDRLMHGIDQEVLRGTDLEGLLNFICNGLSAALDLPFTWVGRKETDGRTTLLSWAGSASGYHEHLEQIGVRWDDTPQGHGPAGTAIRIGQAQMVRVDSHSFEPWRAAAERFGFGAVLALPLVLRGEVYGMIGLYAHEACAFSDALVRERMDNVAARINVALEMNQDHERTRLLGAALASASNGVFITGSDGRIQWCNTAFSKLCGYSEGEIIGRNPSFLKSGRQDSTYYERLWQTIGAGETWSSETVERHRDGTAFTVQQTITPIRDYKGEIRHFISIMEDITAQKATEEKIYHMAHYDALTDLPNRALFRDRLHHAIAIARRGEHQIALLFLDLDKFKSINDSLGHHVGDLLLQGVAARLCECVRECDTVARLAGDEFTVILQHVGSVTDAETVAAKIVARLAEPFQFEGHAIHTAASIGIALAPLHAAEDEALIKLADNAMYQAKSAGRGCYRVHAG